MKVDSNYMFRPIAAIIRFSSDSMVVVLYRITYKALPPYFRMKTWWWPQWAETCSYYHPLLNIFLDIVVLLIDTYTYCEKWRIIT